MAKFNVNENVIVNATGQKGVVMCRETVRIPDTNRTKVSYLVKLGDGFENYKEFTRKELSRVPVVTVPNYKEKTKIIELPSGIVITIVTQVEKVIKDWWFDELTDTEHYEREKTFKMGIAIYNPTDEYPYDKEVGIKIARHRIETAPFCSLKARFLGEFNDYTVDALIEAKARYIVENIDSFIFSE